ncbi:MAG: dihydrofolate reductase family protein [Gemmatimonadaceae bacterium]
MRKLINSTYITLDGVIKNPQDWPSLGSFSDAGTKIQTELLHSCDAVLMGRETYVGFAAVWADRSGDPFTDHINAITKYVVSTTITDPRWATTTVIDRDPVGAVRALKERDGANIVQYGFGSIAHALMAAGLIDELRLWVHPFFVGADSAAEVISLPGSSGAFELDDVTRLDSGIVILSYQLARA